MRTSSSVSTRWAVHDRGGVRVLKHTLLCCYYYYYYVWLLFNSPLFFRDYSTIYRVLRSSVIFVLTYFLVLVLVAVSEIFFFSFSFVLVFIIFSF